ncbi:FIG001385: N-acetylmuramoyl-L-alanine amidase [hydrothermal vent metagenome]|uniref:N-acetylmuramoyl-L-alanine amidase n=1 Tax=hydrothermal vent metagenome TaxID=652676 RepID=A0A3B0RWL5_9ZZZZ
MIRLGNNSICTTARLSPNFDARSAAISMLVLHYTGMQSAEAALQRLCDTTAKVSAHYLVDETAEVFLLVPEEQRAWHAGIAYWRGETDINNISIGIEIVNGGHDFGLPAFADAQINAVIRLCQQLQQHYHIQPANIVGHNEIAPARKLDPGEKFPWAKLAAQGVGLWPGAPDTAGQAVIRPEQFAIAKQALQDIGYASHDIPFDGSAQHCLIAEFQRRYLPDQVDGCLNTQTFAQICKLAALINS